MSQIDMSKLKDPFTWTEPIGDYDVTPKPFEYDNPLKAFYEEIAPPVLERPKAPRLPLAPIRTAQWDPAQGMKGAKYPTFVPLPLPGTTPVTSAQARVPRGTSGKNTMVNLIVDVSGSMGANAASWQGYSFARWEVARICAAIMVKQCQLQDDFFAIYNFQSHAAEEWPGPSLAHADCINWMTSYNPSGMSGGYRGRSFGYPPFYPRGGTNIASGLRLCIEGMKRKRMDKAVTILITDMWDASGDYIYNAAFSSSGEGTKSCDEVLRSYGPVFYLAIGDYGSRSQMKSGQEGLSRRINEFYGKNINPPPGLYEAINPNNSGSAVTLGGSMAKMARMTQG